MFPRPQVLWRNFTRQVLILVPLPVLEDGPVCAKVLPCALRWHPAVEERLHDAAALLCHGAAAAAVVPFFGFDLGGGFGGGGQCADGEEGK